MKRYNINTKPGEIPGGDWDVDPEESENGEWVKFEDVESYNSIEIIEINYTQILDQDPAVRVKYIRGGKKFTAMETDIGRCVSRDELVTQVIRRVLGLESEPLHIHRYNGVSM